MKKFYTLLLLAGLAAAGCNKDELGADRVITYDFDPLFAQELQKRGYVDDAAYITPGKVEGIETLDVSGNDSDYGVLTSLRGIEYFTALTSLDCSSNQLEELDVTKNTALTELLCNNNLLTSLDVTNNTALTELQCSNNKLVALNVSNNVALTSLACSGNNLRELNVSYNGMLTDLKCGSNFTDDGGRLARMLVPGSLEHLSCDWCDFATIDLSSCPNLKTLHCNSCGIKLLNLSRNAALTELYCSQNDLSVLDISPCSKLLKLYCYANELVSLDISKNKELEALHCYENPGIKEQNGESVFAVLAWFDNDNVPEGIVVPSPTEPSQEVKNYDFTTGEWIYPVGSESIVKIDYRNVAQTE